MYPMNDAKYSLESYKDRLREIEQPHLIHAAQPQQPNLFEHLQSQLAIWATRPQQNRTQRA